MVAHLITNRARRRLTEDVFTLMALVFTAVDLHIYSPFKKSQLLTPFLFRDNGNIIIIIFLYP